MNQPLLTIDSLSAGYGRAEVLRGISLSLRRGEFATVIGANGAGKTTLVKAIMGLVRSRGRLDFAGTDLIGAAAHRRAALGVAYVPEGRHVFPGLTVEENLQVVARKGRSTAAQAVDRVLDMFPALVPRRRTHAGSLSGGEQQMLAVGRAIVLDPVLVVADEVTLGLAPVVVDQIVDVLEAMRDEGRAVLLTEQNARVALDAATTAYILEMGEVSLHGPAATLRHDERVVTAYLQNY